MLLTVFTMLCGSVLADEATVTWNASSGDALNTFYVGNDVMLKWEEGSGVQPANYSDGYVNFYNGNLLTISGASADVKISKVVFSFKDETKNGLSTCDSKGKNLSTAGITNDNAALTTTWEGEQNSVIFRAAAQTGARYIKSIEVTYTGAASEEKAPSLNITNANIADTYDMDAAPVFVVYYENKGTAAAENAKLTLYVDNAVNKEVVIGTIAFGTEGWKNMSYDLNGIEAGEHQVYVSLTADNADAFSTAAKTVTFTKKAPEASFALTAPDVELQLPAENFTAVVNVKNTSETNATDVEVNLWYNGVIATQTIASLAAGADQDVLFEVANPFKNAGLYEVQALTANNKYGCKFNVNVLAAPVVDQPDMAITTIQGTNPIDITLENKIQVWYKNEGNVDVTGAQLTVKLNGAEVGTATVDAAQDANGFKEFTLPVEGLTAGEKATVEATIAVEGDVNADNNTMSREFEVINGVPAEATFALSGNDVEVEFDAENISVVVNVKNTSEVNAENVEVKLLNGMTQLGETQTIAALAAGASADVTFTFANPFTKEGTYELQAQAGKAGAWVKVVVKPAAVEPVIDIALIDIRGLENINLSEENNTVMVTFANNSNVDVENATITLKMNGAVVGTQTIASNESFKQFVLPTEGLVAGQEATLVATLAVENNKEGNTVEVTKTLPIVSGEAEPQADIALNGITGWEVEPGEQTVTVSVGVFNNGDADAENVKIDLYRSYPEILDTKTVSLKAGESTFVTFSFDYTFEESKNYEFTVQTLFNDANADNNTQKFTISCVAPLADLTIAKINDVVATTEDEVKVSATVKNQSNVVAKDVKVALYQGTEVVGTWQTIEELAAEGEATIEFVIGQLEAGNYSYSVQIASPDANSENNIQTFSVKVTEPVEQKIEVALSQIQASEIDLAAENNIATVWFENLGNVDAEVVVGMKLNDTDLEAQTVAVAAGKNGYAVFTLPTEGLVAGEKATVAATIAVEGNISEAVSLTKELAIVNSAVPTEPTFSITAPAVEVELGAEKFDVTAVVKNTSAIAAENVEVTLFHNSVIATQIIESLAPEAEALVTFADVENPFTKAGNYTMQVLAGKAGAEVEVVVKAPAVDPVIDLAVEDIIGTLDLAVEQGSVSVAVKNNGNVDVKDAVVTLTYGEQQLGTATVSVKAGETEYAIMTVATEGLEAGELSVTATVEAEGDATAENNTMTKAITVKAIPAAEATFALTVADVEVEAGQKISAVVNVKNTSEVNATNVAVVIYNGMDVLATNTVEAIAAGEAVDVMFEDLGELAVGTHELQATAGKNSTFFNVVVKEAAPEQLIDLAITSISGALSMEVETNYVTVFVENKGNVDVADAPVTLKHDDVLLGSGSVSVKAGKSAFCSIAVPAAMLTAGEYSVVAKVEVENDAEPNDNEMGRTYTIEAPKAALTFSADAYVIEGTQNIELLVTVNNESENIDAENVEVKVYSENSIELCSTVIPVVYAGASKTVYVKGESDKPLTEKSKLQVMVNGTIKWVGVKVTQTTSIQAVKAMLNNSNVQIFTITGKKVNSVQKGGVYIINGKKVMVK